MVYSNFNLYSLYILYRNRENGELLSTDEVAIIGSGNDTMDAGVQNIESLEDTANSNLAYIASEVAEVASSAAADDKNINVT